MAEQWGNLFKWKRQTKRKSHSSRGNVSDWIKRVQSESETAAREVFGSGYRGLLQQVHVDDDALVEAQDLLDSWINDKKLEDLRLEAEFSNEQWAYTSPGQHVFDGQAADVADKGLYGLADSGLLDFNDELNGSVSTAPVYGDHTKIDDFEEELNEEIAVQKVIRDMLDKKVVDQHISSDLGFDESKKRRDPLMKMELRHKQVKEKNETRRKEIEKSKREKSAHKEAEYLARQQLLKEEKEKQTRLRQEEAAIQKEMARIRRVIENEKKLNKEQEMREQQKLQEAESLAQQFLEQEEKKREEKKRVEHEAKEQIRRQLLREMEEKAAEEDQENRRVLNKYFSAWYSAVVSQRIKLGKAGALADWRCKLRAWNAWKTFVHHVRFDKEAQAIQLEMKERHRKERLAERFHQQHLLQHSFFAWQHWVQHELEKKQLMEEHRKKADKMAVLLQAAASGKLWSKPAEADGNSNKLQLLDIENDNVGDVTGECRVSTARKVDDIFCVSGRQAEQREISSKGNIKNKNVASVPQSTSNNNARLSRNTQQAWIDQEKSNTVKDRVSSNRTKLNHSKQKINNIVLETQKTFKTGSDINNLHSPNGCQSTRMQSSGQRTFTEVDNVENLYLRTSSSNTTHREKTASKHRQVKRFLSEEALNNKVTNEDDVFGTQSHSDFGSGGTSARSGSSSRLMSRDPVVKSAKPATKPLYLAMEERAKERAERKAILDEKRRRAEEEKLAQLKLLQEKQELELLKEKQEIMRKKKEEKRILKEQELAKQQRIETMKQLNTMATENYNKTLLRKYGLSPWKQLILISSEHNARAKAHHNSVIMRHCFYPWLEFTREQTEQREKAAELLNRWILLRRCWISWRKYGQHMVRMEAVAEKYCATYLKKKYLRLWMSYVTDEQILYWEKERRADQHNKWRTMKQSMIYWKKLIPLVRSEKEKEKRRAEMRKRVQTWLPDFQGMQNHSP